MKLIKPSFKITSSLNGEEILAAIEYAARTCYKSEDKMEFSDKGEALSARKLVKSLMERGHDAMLEFGGMITVKFICDRGVSHELVRHRLCSFAQESTRYVNYAKGKYDGDLTFIIPCWTSLTEKSTYDKISVEEPLEAEWLLHMQSAETSYNLLIKKGWTPQQARSVLPNSLKTEINMSANIREWRKIFSLRCDKPAHPQMRELMIPLLAEFKRRIPILFDDLIFENE